MRERLFAVRFAVAAAGLCVATPLAIASLVRALDLAELTTGADRIVVADVLSVQAAVGERTLLFLRRSQVVGMSQGKRSLRWEPIERCWLVDPADRSEVVTIDRNGGLRAAGAGRAEALDSLRDKVGGLLGR